VRAACQGRHPAAFECFAIEVQRPPAEPDAAGSLHEEAALTAARIGEHDAMRRWIAVAERCYREAGQPERGVRMLLDPTFDYLPVGRSRRAREEPVERLLADALAALGRGDPGTAHGLVDAAVETARARSDGMALARAARMVLFGLGEFERGEDLLNEALTCPDMAVHPGRESRVLTIRACSRIARGYPLEALELLRQGAAISRQEAEAVLWPGHLALGDALLSVGRVEEGTAMLADAARARSAGRLVDQVDSLRRFEGGDVAGSLAALDAATADILSELDFDPLGRAVAGSRILRVQALAEVHGGRPGAALSTVRQLDVLSPEPFNDVSADLAYVLARAGAALGNADALAEAGRRIGEIVRVASGPGVIGAVEAVRGFTALAAGRTDEAARHLQAAAELYDRAPRAVLAAELWCDAALAAGPGDAAADALQRASRVCESNGLVRVAAPVVSVRDELAARPPPAPTVLAELTPRERDVVLLVAEGLSNREVGGRLYLAEGTVRNYLSTAFDKLGISRRVELARLIAAPRRPDAG
jgi:DNA-binding CsgD family transcriptional regulator